MFEIEYGEAAVEVLDILDNTRKEDVKKIPSSFIKFLVDNASCNYVVNLDHSKPINELNIKEKTKEILGVIYINWWCDKKDQEQYKKKIKEQEIRKQEEIREKYDPNKIFENKKVQRHNKLEETAKEKETFTIIEYKENIFKRIINKILKLFKKQ